MHSREKMIESDNALLDLFLELSGFDQSPDKHERHSLGLQRVLTVLGVAYTLDKLCDGISLSIAAEKVQRLHHMGNTLLAQFKSKTVDFDLLLSFRGLYRHAAQLNLQLAHIIRGLDKWADAENFSGWITQRKFRQSLRRLVKTLLFLQRKQVSRRLAPRLLDMPTAHLYTDASLEDMQGISEKLRKGDHGAIKDHDAWIGGVIVLPDGRRRAFRIQVTALPRHVNYCHIGVLEFLALRVATRIFSREMKSHYTVAHIDNLANVYISIRGTSTCSVTQNLCAAWIEECIAQQLATYSSWISTIRNVSDVLTRKERFEIILRVFPAPSDQFARDFVCEMSQQDDAPDATAADTYKEGLEEYHASLRTQTDVEAAIAAIKSKTLNNGVNFLPFNEVFETMTFHSGYPKRIPYADAPEKMKEIMKYGVPQKTQSAGGIPVPMPPMGILRSYSVVTPPAVFNDHLLLHNQEAVEAGHNSTCTELSHKIRLEKTDFDRKLSGVQLKVSGMLIGERYAQPTTMRCPSEKQLTDVTLIFNDVVKILKDPNAGLIDKNKVLESVKLLYLFLNAAVDQVDGQYLSWADWRMKYSLELLFQLNYMSLRRDDEGGISAVSSKNEIFMRLFDSKGSAPGKQLS
eukprot:g8948.t1